MKFHHQDQGWPVSRSRPRYLSRVPTALVAVAVSTLGSAASINASSGSFNLGKPTTAMPQPAIGAFYKVSQTFPSHGKPELLFIGSQGDGWSAAERWPVVKALSQFGTWSGLAASTSVNGPTANSNFGEVPTFDWLHARYQSRYVALDHKDMLDSANHVLQHLSSVESKWFNRYAPLNDPRTSAPFPLVVIGRYVMHGPGLPAGEFLDSSGHDYAFDTVMHALQRVPTGNDPLYPLINSINQETNLEIALICHVDGKRPANVCGRSVIRRILKHLH